MEGKKLEYVRGAAIHATATSRNMKTGTWRVFRPDLAPNTCKQCNLCVLFCPEACMRLTDSAIAIDFDYCKGCGICAEECPHNALSMIREDFEK